jgi:hypothetical protein
MTEDGRWTLPEEEEEILHIIKHSAKNQLQNLLSPLPHPTPKK